MQNIETLEEQAQEAICNADSLQDLDAVRVAFLGKKGHLTDILKGLAHLSAADKPAAGQRINLTKQRVLAAIETRLQVLQTALLEKKCTEERVDVTLPGRQSETGSLHPVTQIRRRIEAYFSRLGFDTVDGPEIETPFYNFEALNIPESHPARAMHDTFYLPGDYLLRTHTSPVQIRAMENRKPPFRLIAPGRVYRCDSDVTHTPMFHQVEGLWVDESTTLSELRGILQDFFKDFFGHELALRFRPSYFPFTEPSAEVDVQCTQCLGKGCRACKHTGWLEVLGCGMVHPYVLESVGISPETYQGWAFGMGIDRLAMLYFGIDDLRAMFENDIAFLRQF